MIRAITEFFESRINHPLSSEGDDHALQLATAALLVEMSRADFKTSADEHQAVADGLRDFFDLTVEETETLVELARQEADEGASLYQFTSLVAEHFEPEQKSRVIELMWRVTYADGHKDMHEEHLVRKLAKLLYVPHREFIRTRLAVESELARRRSGQDE